MKANRQFEDKWNDWLSVEVLAENDEVRLETVSTSPEVLFTTKKARKMAKFILENTKKPKGEGNG